MTSEGYLSYLAIGIMLSPMSAWQFNECMVQYGHIWEVHFHKLHWTLKTRFLYLAILARLVLIIGYSVNFTHIKWCTRQAAAFDASFNFCVCVLNGKQSCHVLLYNTSTVIRCPSKGVQFNNCRLQGCAKFALIKLPQYQQRTLYLSFSLFSKDTAAMT